MGKRKGWGKGGRKGGRKGWVGGDKRGKTRREGEVHMATNQVLVFEQRHVVGNPPPR